MCSEQLPGGGGEVPQCDGGQGVEGATDGGEGTAEHARHEQSCISGSAGIWWQEVTSPVSWASFSIIHSILTGWLIRWFFCWQKIMAFAVCNRI